MSKLPCFEGEAYGRRRNGCPTCEIQVQTTEPHGLSGGLFFMDGSSKDALRDTVIVARLRLSPQERAALSHAVAERVVVLDAFVRAQTVALYAPMGAGGDTAEGAAGGAARG